MAGNLVYVPSGILSMEVLLVLGVLSQVLESLETPLLALLLWLPFPLAWPLLQALPSLESLPEQEL